MKFTMHFLSISALLMLTACNQQGSAEEAAGGGAMPPTQVSTMKVSPRDVPVSFEYVGQVAGSHEVEVRARVTGIVEKRLFQEGTSVKAGDVLFKIDAEPFRAKLGQANAALAMAKASKASVRAELKKAERDYARIAPLTQKKMLSRSELDNTESAIELAKAAMQQADASIMQANASIRTAQVNFDYTTIKAPISGIIGRVLKTEGSLAEAGSNSLLATIAQTNPAYINFGVSENEQVQHQQEISAGKLLVPAEGYTVQLKTATGSLLEQTGRVNFQDYKIDPSTGNFSMRATIENPKQTLSPGQFVRVILQGGERPNAFLVPQRAVLDSPQGKYVYVATKNEQGAYLALRREVEVGEWVQLEGDLKNAWIIKSGLKQGDEVVIDGMARIFFPGMPIQPASEQDVAKAPDATLPPSAKAKPEAAK
ncbi:MAG: RND efflux system, membrane fusion protein CmeA [uncultured Thiotrichaceae bacterium]|uniref:RND efflux system, membrane fusion protein CmeA n=1 Tax=uncultured Thiotrichaceae bacterium TaxID=298394 RepID=A0A6S6SVS2_9GAMM|nr:MAG: RND efflux system, membrane fusion protein CmeA [uncultured Thiotrichaceae bacterium]